MSPEAPMVQEQFLRAFDLVIGSEGGYVNDPKDPGGETKWGISKRAYPHLDIKNLSRDDVKPIYYTDYWQKLGLDSQPWKIAYPAFDTGVNLGVFAASGLLKTALRQPNPTRHLLAQRAIHYTKLATFSRFGDGWLDRVVGVALESH